MDFLEIATQRFSVRHFLDKKVENEKLENILNAGNVAPTSGNVQPHKILVIQDPSYLDKLTGAANTYHAPLVLIVCGDHRNLWERSFDKKNLLDIDVSIVTDHMMLEAFTQGLGSVWICLFNPYIIKSAFNIPDYLEPINILAIGYPAEDAFSLNVYHNNRKSLDETVIYNSFR